MTHLTRVKCWAVCRSFGLCQCPQTEHLTPTVHKSTTWMVRLENSNSAAVPVWTEQLWKSKKQLSFSPRKLRGTDWTCRLNGLCHTGAWNEEQSSIRNDHIALSSYLLWFSVRLCPRAEFFHLEVTSFSDVSLTWSQNLSNFSPFQN